MGVSIIHPLNQIRLYISQIKQGKDVELNINREDEIGDVAHELISMKEELTKQEKSKEEMIHNISHDLKTPIATIKSYSESIKDGIYPYGDLESSVDVILDNAQLARGQGAQFAVFEPRGIFDYVGLRRGRDKYERSGRASGAQFRGH